jgi:glycosyltransferase involved in cell wall biosynthesis
MHIMFLSHYFPPEVNAPASRTFENCRTWVRAGHEVTVVTCAPNHPQGKIYSGYSNRHFQVEDMDGIRTVRVRTLIAANEGFVLRSLNYLSYLVSVAFALPRLPRPDIVVSTSPQFFCGLAGFVVGAVKRVPWVLEVRDLWPESIVTVGAIRSRCLVRLLERLESFAYGRASRIVSVTDSFVAHIVRKGGTKERIAVIKNGADLALFRADARGASHLKRALGLEAKFVAAYVGTHGLAHGLETVLGAAHLLRNDSRIVFLFVGDGAERASLLQKKIAMALDNVVMLGQQPKSTMPGVWRCADAALIVLKRNDLFKKVIPSKMFEAMAMARPIVLGLEGEARDLLHSAGAGISITPEKPDELAAAVKRLADDTTNARELGARGLAYVQAHFDRNMLSLRYLEMLEKTVAESKTHAATHRSMQEHATS